MIQKICPTAHNQVIYDDDDDNDEDYDDDDDDNRGSYVQPLAFQPNEKLCQKSQLQFFKRAAAATQRLKIKKILLGWNSVDWRRRQKSLINPVWDWMQNYNFPSAACIVILHWRSKSKSVPGCG